jgi:hypothetical protein
MALKLALLTLPLLNGFLLFWAVVGHGFPETNEYFSSSFDIGFYAMSLATILILVAAILLLTQPSGSTLGEGAAPFAPAVSPAIRSAINTHGRESLNEQTAGSVPPLNRRAVWSGALGVACWLCFIGYVEAVGHSPELNTILPFLGTLVLCITSSLGAVISGGIARSQIRRSTEAGSDIAMFGVIAGYICLLLTLVTLPIALFGVAQLGCNADSSCG